MALLVLPGSVVDRVVSKFTPNELVNLMAKVFIDLSASSRTPEGTAKNIIIPHRSTVSSHNHHALFMPSRLAPLAGTAIKIVSVPTAQAPAEIKAGGLPREHHRAGRTDRRGFCGRKRSQIDSSTECCKSVNICISPV